MIDYLSIPSLPGNRSTAEKASDGPRFPPLVFDYLSIPSLGVASIPSLPPPGGEGGRESKLPGTPRRGKTSNKTITSPSGNRSGGNRSLSVPSRFPPASLGGAPVNIDALLADPALPPEDEHG